MGKSREWRETKRRWIIKVIDYVSEDYVSGFPRTGKAWIEQRPFVQLAEDGGRERRAEKQARSRSEIQAGKTEKEVLAYGVDIVCSLGRHRFPRGSGPVAGVFRFGSGSVLARHEGFFPSGGRSFAKPRAGNRVHTLSEPGIFSGVGIGYSLLSRFFHGGFGFVPGIRHRFGFCAFVHQFAAFVPVFTGDCAERFLLRLLFAVGAERERELLAVVSFFSGHVGLAVAGEQAVFQTGRHAIPAQGALPRGRIRSKNGFCEA